MPIDKVLIQTALFSVTNKSGLVEFAKGLIKLRPHLKIIASGGTANKLSEGNVPITQVHEYTQFPSCFGDRVKTLHPKILGGILFRRGIDEEESKKLVIPAIDLVVCNLYDFKGALQRPESGMDKLIESMDIGGSTLIRSASKNFAGVTVVVDPADYPILLKELEENHGAVSLNTRQRLAAKAMKVSADYEALLANEFMKQFADHDTHRPHLIQGKKLRYGENPDQQAWVYQFEEQEGIAQAEILSGKELSFNNYEDATLAFRAAVDLKLIGSQHGVAIVKHGSLCAYATGNTIEKAFDKAWEGDAKSSFGSVIAFTSAITDSLIPNLKDKFVEVLVAPEFSSSFVEWCKQSKPNLRLLKTPIDAAKGLLYKSISGGMLVQTQKERTSHPSLNALLLPCQDPSSKKRIGVVTKRLPDPQQKTLWNFAISAVQFAKSNAIAIVREYEPGCYQLLGMGAGQPNRIDSFQRLAIPKAIENLRNEHAKNSHYDPKCDLNKCIVASDGFFPFDDSIRYAASEGIKSIIQPGGSTRDQEAINAADELDICMIFTGERYFYH